MTGLGIIVLSIFPAVADGELPNATCASGTFGSLECLGRHVHNSWVAQLEPDAEQERHVPNHLAREVSSGHYVFVRPSPLPEPYLVACSPEMAALLGLDEKVCTSERFVRLFSGDTSEVPAFGSSWATPYALSIYGQEQFPNGAGPDGNGYGDGRAISLGEVLAEDGARWELQLKGSGPTPFCRGSDGRAVLRSSVREFLASEAMHHLGVPTTRALSLVASGSEHVTRPWYSETTGEGGAGAEKHGGDVMQEERCAMTTRVAPSFLRVGHFELFGRRARKGDAVGKRQLEQLARHALFREYPHLVDAKATLQSQLLAMVAEASTRFANLSAEWLRVGYTQSNFNADNCLVSGLTVDYGPFGFIERYDPEWGMWIHSGQHFSFMNQPKAAEQNFNMFARSLAPLMDKDGRVELRQILSSYGGNAQKAVDAMWARKLGLQNPGAKARALHERLEALMREHPTDYTILWRQLAEVLGLNAASTENGLERKLLEPLELAFYEPLPSDLRAPWATWLQDWLALLALEGRASSEVASAMRRASPKFVPRESMLVDAYTAAQRGDHSVVRALMEVFRRPYDEQPFFGERYYSRQAKGADNRGGVGFMS